MAPIFASRPHIHKKVRRIRILSRRRRGRELRFRQPHHAGIRKRCDAPPTLRIDLSKRLWHDAAGMSLKETFARDGFVGIRGFFGAHLAAAGVSG